MDFSPQGIKIPAAVVNGRGDLSITFWVHNYHYNPSQKFSPPPTFFTALSEPPIVNTIPIQVYNGDFRAYFNNCNTKSPFTLRMENLKSEGWDFLVYTRAANGSVAFYINRVLQKNSSLDAGLLKVANDGFSMGYNQGQITGGWSHRTQFYGDIDDFAFSTEYSQLKRYGTCINQCQKNTTVKLQFDKKP